MEARGSQRPVSEEACRPGSRHGWHMPGQVQRRGLVFWMLWGQSVATTEAGEAELWGRNEVPGVISEK